MKFQRLKSFLKKYLDSPDPVRSDIDQFLHQFDEDHPEKSASQLKEIAKAKAISDKM